MRTAVKKPWLIAAGIALIILGAFPLFTGSNYLLAVGVTFCVFATLGSAWNLIGGYAGQVGWCYATFLAIGAYTSFILFLRFGISPWLGMLAGMAISALAAVFIGSISFKLRGPFFSLSTIAFAELVRVYLNWHKDLTKGSNGLVVPYRQQNFWHLMFDSSHMYYYILLVFLIITVLICWRISLSRMGYFLRAIKADEDAVCSLGISPNRVKTQAFVISAMIASAVGTVYAFFLSYIDPQSMASLDVSTKIGTMAIVGGLGTLSGPLIGAAFLVPLSEVANILLGSSGAGMLLYGLLLILVFVFRPEGIVSFLNWKKKGSGPIKKEGSSVSLRKGGNGHA
ncbi:MAG TPA: branched-chain amino acid ABC transporter permease [Candidatus Pullichristensenella stercorigallinarum]|uniref:Branched-chain amino acid ABC transporter permease n=1 Tax=Candidatus Pullichristensenella stercorigallinarum TaxID=2840909 RepID=A0A9D1CWC1_9FIRM|nr:branched-chain amino acid ABC transporter permease [Candidatus Pullichristensenella stercorigallinarum]